VNAGVGVGISVGLSVVISVGVAIGMSVAISVGVEASNKGLWAYTWLAYRLMRAARRSNRPSVESIYTRA
jgi:tetrahydrodipicolinate N-succinyltransferase